MKFRKKPVVIEAIQFNGHNRYELISWAHEGLPREANSIIVHDVGGCLSIRTLEGSMTACEKDWIIKGIKGEFYPCRPDIFEATYERVDEAGVKKGEAR